MLWVTEGSCPILAGIELVPPAEKFKGNESAVGLLLLLTLAKTACAKWLILQHHL